MIIHVETKNIGLFIVLWTFYDVVNDRFIKPTWRVRIKGRRFGHWGGKKNIYRHRWEDWKNIGDF